MKRLRQWAAARLIPAGNPGWESIRPVVYGWRVLLRCQHDYRYSAVEVSVDVHHARRPWRRPVTHAVLVPPGEARLLGPVGFRDLRSVRTRPRSIR